MELRLKILCLIAIITTVLSEEKFNNEPFEESQASIVSSSESNSGFLSESSSSSQSELATTQIQNYSEIMTPIVSEPVVTQKLNDFDNASFEQQSDFKIETVSNQEQGDYKPLFPEEQKHPKLEFITEPKPVPKIDLKSPQFITQPEKYDILSQNENVTNIDTLLQPINNGLMNKTLQFFEPRPTNTSGQFVKQNRTYTLDLQQRNIVLGDSLENKRNVSKSPPAISKNMNKLISDLEKAIILEAELEDLQHNYTNNDYHNLNETSDHSFILRPNILVIMADDLGWNDVSYHGSNQILTPNIDVLQFHGITIQEYYTDTSGTASRSAFFTGKYASRMGTQGPSILAYEDRGVPTEERFLSSYLKDLGYATHMIGKWDVGKSREYYWPTNRGFDSFFGFLDSSVDYYTYNYVEIWNNSELSGLDLHRNLKPAEDGKGHLTDLLTEHAIQLIREHNNSKPLYIQLCHAAPHAGGGLVSLQPPPETIQPNDYIAHSARRLFAGMTTSLDRSIGNLVAALAEVDILRNTIIVFASDNGAAPVGPTQNFGSNLPLRGLKGTPWEGGVRSAAFLWHAELKSTVWDGLFHVTDWLPTLVAAAGSGISTPIDGVNQWDSIRLGLPSKRKDALITLDDLQGFAAIRDGNFKYIIGDVDKEKSIVFGKDLVHMRFEPPLYETALLECETARVLKETLLMKLNLTNLSIKRNETTLKKLDKQINATLCVPSKEKGCLFNVKTDPEEIYDISTNATELIKRLNLKLRTLWAESKPRRQPIPDNRSDPKYHNYVWTHWLQNDEPLPEPLLVHPEFPQKVTQGELQYLVDLNLESFKQKVLLCIQNMGDSFVRSIGGLFNFN